MAFVSADRIRSGDVVIVPIGDDVVLIDDVMYAEGKQPDNHEGMFVGYSVRYARPVEYSIMNMNDTYMVAGHLRMAYGINLEVLGQAIVGELPTHDVVPNI